jgi:hypothetical protein
MEYFNFSLVYLVIYLFICEFIYLVLSSQASLVCLRCSRTWSMNQNLFKEFIITRTHLHCSTCNRTFAAHNILVLISPQEFEGWGESQLFHPPSLLCVVIHSSHHVPQAYLPHLPLDIPCCKGRRSIVAPCSRSSPRYYQPSLTLEPICKAALPPSLSTVVYFTHVHALIKGWTRILIKNVSMFSHARVVPEIINDQP